MDSQNKVNDGSNNPALLARKAEIQKIAKYTGISFLALLIAPLLTIAIEPTNPAVVCERFLADDLKSKCQEKAKADDIDWYAANACNNIQDDAGFFRCWDHLKGGIYNPEAMDLCARGESSTDEQKLKCFEAMKGRNFSKNDLKTCSAKVSNSEEAFGCLNSLTRIPASESTPIKNSKRDVKPTPRTPVYLKDDVFKD